MNRPTWDTRPVEALSSLPTARERRMRPTLAGGPPGVVVASVCGWVAGAGLCVVAHLVGL
jgi:hypothetical protein